MINIIAISGGSCSGKTTLAHRIRAFLGENLCDIIYQDNYYHGRPDIDNYDHPDAIDFDLMRSHIAQLKQGNSIDMPVYDFVTHRRSDKYIKLEAKPVIIVDGILILHAKELQQSFDYRVFVECPEKIRMERRLLRDCTTRGRLRDDVYRQFTTQVAPLHDEFVEPSKLSADSILNQENLKINDESYGLELFSHCHKLIGGRSATQ